MSFRIRPQAKFSNGDPLTSSDVKYSFERAIKIQDANGAAIYLLGSITDTANNATVSTSGLFDIAQPSIGA